MKKTLFLMSALLLTAIGASAQTTTDFTWALNAGTWTGNTGTYDGGVERYSESAYSGSTTSPTKILYETVTDLPAGNYELTFFAVANSAWIGATYGDNIAQVYVIAGGTTYTEDVTVYDQTGCTPSDHSYTFTVTVTDGTLEYGLQNIATGGNWYVCQGVSLMYSGEAVTRKLEPGDVVEEESGSESSLSHYELTYTGSGINGGLDYNTWSGESGMTTPYHQVWVASSNTLSDMTIDHYQIPLLPVGYYTVTVDARVLSEADNAIGKNSAFFNANGKSVDIVASATTDEEFAYGNATEHEVNGSYSIVAYVGDDGTLDIGFTITSATYNWIAWKNLSVVYVGDEAPAEVHACEADLGDYDSTADRYFPAHWTASPEISASNFHVNTWSNEGESDDSGMTTPFCEYWVYGSTLSAATISHNTLTGLEPGVYTVSMDIRIYSEGGSAIGTGTTFSANGVSEDIASGTDANPSVYNEEVLVYGTYTLSCIVYDDGTLDISINIPDGVTYNWIAWKNLSVTYSGPITAPAIGEAKASKTVVTPGEEVTITFKKVAPSDGSYTLNGTGFTDSGSGIAVSYTTDGVFTFTVPSDAASNSTFTITIPAGQLAYNDTEVLSAEQTLTFTVPYVLKEELTSGMFLQNLYAGDLLSRGKNLGTRADADFVGIPLTLTMNDDGKYTIWYADADPDWGETTNAYLYGENWAWADGSASQATTFSIEEVSDESTGELLGYHFVSDYGYLYRYDAEKASATDYDDNYALAVNGNYGENYSDDSQVIWTFVDKDKRNELKAAWVESQKVAVATEAGLSIDSGEAFDSYVAELTATMIESDALTYTLTGWTTTNSPTVSSSGYGVEAFQTYARMQRTITGLTPGLYKVTLNGLDRHSDNAYSLQMYQNGYTDLSESYLYANGYEINLLPWASKATYSNEVYTPDDMAGASGMFGDGTEDSSYLNTLYTYVGEDGNLEIDIALLVTETRGWAMVKNYKLYYLGEEALEIGSDDEYAKGDEVTVDGTLYTVVSDNLFTNGGFNNGVEGWTAGNGEGGYTDPLATNAVKIFWGGFNGNPYIALPQAVGAANTATPTQAMGITSGKQYLFIGYTNGNVPTSGNMQYSSLYEMSGATTEVTDGTNSTPYVTLTWGAEAEGTSTEWTKTMAVFDAITDYAGMRMNWSTGCYDGFQLYEIEEPTEIEWTLGADFGTLILPFDYDLSADTNTSGLTAYTVENITDATGDESATLNLSTGTTSIAANTPYIIGGTEGEYTFIGIPTNEADSYTSDYLTGVLEATKVPNDGSTYVLQNQTEASGLAFYLVNSDDITCGAYHCYLNYTAPAGAKLVVNFPGGGIATAVEAVETEEASGSGAVYDLSGRRVAKAQKGVYIVDGKKKVIK